MALTRPVIAEIEKDTYQINEFGLECMYVLVGSERALVVDTGMGYCDFKSIVEHLTSLPVQVVITHGHVDHAGGADQFQEVYLHPNDLNRARSIHYERRLKDGDTFRLPNSIWEYGPENVRNWKDFPPVKELFDGLVFELGGRTVTTVYTPGHTYGSCSFLDSKTRIAFIGDALGNVPKSFVSKRLTGLMNLKKHAAEFDRMYASHASRMINSLSIPKIVLDDAIRATELVLARKAELIYNSSHFEHTSTRASAIYGHNCFTFDINRIEENGVWDPDYQLY